jgi:hypothetical protein
MNPLAVLTSALVVVLSAAGCSVRFSETEGSPTTPRPVVSTAPVTNAPAAEPGSAGQPDVPPAGRVVQLGNAPEGLVVGSSGMGAAAVRNPDAVVLFDATTGAVRQTVKTSGAARHLALAGPDGPVLAPLEQSNELLQLNLATAA